MHDILIAADYPIYPERVGGMDRFFIAFDTELKRRNLNPAWVFPETRDASHYAACGLSLQFVPRQDFGTHIARTLAFDGGARALVTHFVAYNTRFPAAWKRSGAKTVICVDHMSRPMHDRPRAYRVREFLKGCVNLLHVDAVIAVSEFVRLQIARELGPWWKQRTITIHNGVDIRLYPGKAPSAREVSQPTIYAIGYLIWEKGVHVLINAIDLLKRDGICCRLVIAGDGPARVDLEHLVRRLGLMDSVSFLGETHDQIRHFAELDVTVIPSIWQEAFGLVVAEAMASGACVVVSRTGGMPELTEGTNACLFTPGDPQELGDVLKRLLASTRLRQSIRESCHVVAHSRFTLERMVAEHVDFVQERLQ